MEKIINIWQGLALCVVSAFFISCGDFKEMTEGEITSTFLESIEIDQTEIYFNDSESQKSLSIDADCDWTIAEIPDWLTITPNSGSGNRTVTISTNSTSDVDRSATILIKGDYLKKKLFVSQQKSPFIKVDASKLDFPKNGGESTINVFSNTIWKINNTEPSWCHLSIMEGVGNKSIIVTCDNNSTNNDRYDQIIISSSDSTITIPVFQSKATYYITIVDKKQVFNCDGGSSKFDVQSNIEWIYEKSQNPGSFARPLRDGNIMTLTIDKNPYAYERRDTLIFKGVEYPEVRDSVYITQKPQPPYLKLNNSEDPELIHFGSAGGTQFVSIESNAEWRVNIACDDQGSWCRLLTPSTGVGMGNGSVALSIDGNPIGSEQRSATITISTTSGSPSVTRTVKLIQAPGEEAFIRVADDVSELNFNAIGETLTFRIESNIGWRIVNAPSWCAVSPTESSLIQTVTVVAERNGNSDKRSATLSISPNPSNSKVSPVTIALNQDPLAIPGGGDNPNPHYSRKH